jgi:hypothetical protein
MALVSTLENKSGGCDSGSFFDGKLAAPYSFNLVGLAGGVPTKEHRNSNRRFFKGLEAK